MKNLNNELRHVPSGSGTTKWLNLTSDIRNSLDDIERYLRCGIKMFTLSFPVRIPSDRTFYDDGSVSVPKLPGGLRMSVKHLEGFPLVLMVSGFPAEEEAKQFASVLSGSLRWASLALQHSISPSLDDVVVSQEAHYDGSKPTVFPVEVKALPYHTTESVVMGLHIATLSAKVVEALTLGIPRKLSQNKELSLALELFADVEFSGATNARFTVLFAALEVLVPRTSSKGKRGMVVALVKKALSNDGDDKAKLVGKALDRLYIARNELMHEAKAVSPALFEELRTIVREVLSALISKQTSGST